MTSPTPPIALTALVDAIAPEPAPTRAGSGRGAGAASTLRNWVGLFPFFAFVGLFLIVPTIAVFAKALDAGDEGGRIPMRAVIDEPFRSYFVESIKLSVASAVIGGIIGILLALTVVRMQRPRWLRTTVSAFAGVAANMGGVVLAFMFVAALGTQGLATKILASMGVSMNPTFITSFWGLVTVYLFFQIPLMFLVMLPAVDGLKPAWREAVANLGGTSLTYWRRVGGPVLAPAALGGLLLLFANSFAAYATAYALTTQSANLVSVQIRFYMSGNVLAGQANIAYALAAWMIVIMLVTVGFYLILRRRAERWQR
jgi:putative spermidine/putrescine transport system permease protein